MTANFLDIHAAADYIGPGAIEVPLYQTEILDIVRRRNLFGQRIRQVPATGHPSRYFEQTAIPNPSTAGFVDPRNIVAPVVKDLVDTIDGVMLAHDVALWNGSDTSLSTPTTMQYFGAAGQIAAGGNTTTIATTASITDGLKSTIALMCANTSFAVRPTAIYANPVLLDLLDREMKAEFNVVMNTKEIAAGFTVKMLVTQAGELPLIPDWSLAYTGTPGTGSAVLPAYIVTEDLIEYHWLSEPNPRVFQLGLPGSLASQHVVVKFGAPVVKGANYAHYQVLVDR
jgi:hypothetical protein